MVWSQYLEHTITKQSETTGIAAPVATSDDLPPNVHLHYDDWCTTYSDDLYNLWNSVTSYTQDACIQASFLNGADFGTFCQFCFENSSQMKKKYR